VRAVFEHQVSLRWRDVDALGHVNHAVFLTYLEEGRDAFYVQALGRDPHYVVVRVEIDLRAEVRYTDRQLRVRIEAERVGTTHRARRPPGISGRAPLPGHRPTAATARLRRNVTTLGSVSYLIAEYFV
jgi:hypothetical protein